ncbi:Rrf2 family transcriptional regulator [Bacillus sp. 2205SS5-2]|uniref:Rrf2 family transcriptional regulator n=1 Tax=Bacillus sp. 2205SS5-2 TaxID=3109031 RepID=UPI0030072051
MVNTKFSVAIHILSLITYFPKNQLTSEFIASSVNTNPVVVRRISSLLKKAGLIEVRAGITGSTLTKEPAEISLFDVYKAVQQQDSLFNIHEMPNLDCPVGGKIQSALDFTFVEVQKTMEDELKNRSLKDVINHFTPAK